MAMASSSSSLSSIFFSHTSISYGYGFLLLLLLAFSSIFCILKLRFLFRFRLVWSTQHPRLQLHLIHSLHTSPPSGNCFISATSVFTAHVHAPPSLVEQQPLQQVSPMKDKLLPPDQLPLLEYGLKLLNRVGSSKGAFGRLLGTEMREMTFVDEVGTKRKAERIIKSQLLFCDSQVSYCTGMRNPITSRSLDKTSDCDSLSSSDVVHSQFHVHIPHCAHSLLPSLQLLLHKPPTPHPLLLDTQWDSLLKLRLQTVLQRGLLSLSHTQHYQPPFIRVTGPSYSLVAKGQVVRLWDGIKGLPLKTLQFTREFVTGVGVNWEAGLASIAKSNGMLSIWDLNTTQSINGFSANEGVINAVDMDGGLQMTFTGVSHIDKMAFSISLWDSRVWNRPAGRTRAMQGVLQGFGIRNNDVYITDVEKSSLHDLRMLEASPVKVEEGSDGQATLTEFAHRANQEVQETWWDSDAVLMNADNEDSCDDWEWTSTPESMAGDGGGGKSIVSRCVDAFRSVASALTI